jgi:methylmalonyl-CoA/ethylmalonyl-CoA epimerase
MPSLLAAARLCDIGIVAKNLDKTVARLEALGFGPFVPALPPPGAGALLYRGRPLTARFRGLCTHLGEVELEVIEPAESPNPWEGFVKTHGEGIHHLGFRVDDVEKAVEALTARGAEVTLAGDVHGKLAAAYVELKAAGLTLELMNYHSESSPAHPVFSRPWDVAVLVEDLDKAAARLEALGVGAPVPAAGSEAPEGAEGLFYLGKPFPAMSPARILRVGNVSMELIQPDARPNPWSAFLKTHGEGIHHVGFRVDDVDAELQKLTAEGARVPFYGRISGKTGAAYVDLQTASLFIELTNFGG